MREIQVLPAPDARQTDIFFDAGSYSAFPNVVKLDADELVLSFRQAPWEGTVIHVHPRSIITVIRSYDGGQSWDCANAVQVAAGGGQELGLIDLGGGRIGGALAWHEVVPGREQKRTGIRKLYEIEHSFRTPGSWWVWSDTYGLTWNPGHILFVGVRTMPCAPPLRLSDGTILYPAYGEVNSGDLMQYSTYIYRSADDGATWSAPTVMAQGAPQTRTYHEPVVIEIKPGHLRALHRIEDVAVGTPGEFWTNESFDNGHTWTEPQATGILSGACPRLLKLRDGRLLLTFGRRFEPCAIRAMLSKDGGQSWGDTAWVIREAPNGNQGYTSCVEFDNGLIFTATYMENEASVTGIVGTFWRLPS